MQTPLITSYEGDRKAFKIMTLPPGTPGSLASLLLAKTVY
jgi:hypothetical protein